MNNWYVIVNKLCFKLAKKYNVPFETVVGILVSLSAQKNWKTNIKQTIQFLKGRKLTGMYSNAQLNTCNRILSGENPLQIWSKTSFKYRNFYGSILDPADKSPVCIDAHMINWYLQEYKGSKLQRVEKKSIFANRGNYSLIQQAVRKEATKRNIVPSHCQALIWVEQRQGKMF